MARTRGKSRTPIGELFYRLVLLIRRLIEAFKHVKTGGKSTERRARARAAAPPRRCPECRQPVTHSDRWEDHLDHIHDHNVDERPLDGEDGPDQGPDQH